MYKLNYNYHSHTFRCGHAKDVYDRQYVGEAIVNRYEKYGISDHVPVYPLFYHDKKMRMHDREVKEYLDSIKKMKEEYKEKIILYSAFEAEYDEVIESYLCSLRDKCDYMILGQHYIMGKNISHSINYPLEYAKKVCKAIESGIFDIIAHPDIFMLYQDRFTGEKEDIYIDNCVYASRMICNKAKEYNIPLELNLGRVPLENEVENPGYPNSLFWDIATDVGNGVVVGGDIHDPAEVVFLPFKLSLVGRYINLEKLNIIRDYDPVFARTQNDKLRESYYNTKCNLTSVESRLVQSYDDIFSLIDRLRSFPDGREKKNLYSDILTYLKRKELINVIKSSETSDLVDYVDRYYSHKQNKVKRKER